MPSNGGQIREDIGGLKRGLDDMTARIDRVSDKIDRYFIADQNAHDIMKKQIDDIEASLAFHKGKVAGVASVVGGIIAIGAKALTDLIFKN